MPVVCLLIQKESGSTWWRLLTRVDAGTSIWLHREIRSDFDAEALMAGGCPVFVRAWFARDTHV
jgi:hypothetical protein